MGEHRGRSEREAARLTMLGVKQRLPVDRFDVREGTLFLSAHVFPPRAVFAVGLIGIRYGLVAVEYDVPFSSSEIEAMIEYQVGRLLVMNPPS